MASDPPEPKYDVALSFAGEDREYVQQVAAALRDLDVLAFYDKHEKASLWGKDLYTHLDGVYRKESRYCVIFISDAYAKKVWTNHERASAQARALEENREYILPARFDETEIPGLKNTISYLDISTMPPIELAAVIKKKLGPREASNVLPGNLGRLNHALHLEGTGKRTVRKRKQTSKVALSFYEALERMDATERRAVGGVLAFGCIGELPDGIHISLDYLTRMTRMSPKDLTDALGRVRSLNVKVRLRNPVHQVEGDDLVADDRDLLLSYWSPRAPDYADSSRVIYEMVHAAAKHYCADHGLEVIERLDFSLLADTASSSPMTLHSAAETGETGASSLEIAT